MKKTAEELIKQQAGCEDEHSRFRNMYEDAFDYKGEEVILQWKNMTAPP